FFAFAAALPALCIEIPGHCGISLNSALLRRTATVVRHGRHVGDAGDLETYGVKGAHRGLASRTRALDQNLDVLDAAFLGKPARLLGRNLRGKGGRFARTLETVAARSRPCQRIALAVGDGDDGVVERRVHVGNALGDVLLDLLANPGACLSHIWSLSITRQAAGF